MTAENIKNWNTDADSNTTVNGISIAEGFPPANINNAMRAIMASIKSFAVNVDLSNISTSFQLPIIAAAGTTEAITATYSPAITLTDKMTVLLVALGANTSTTPTFNPNALGAKTIVKNGGAALVVGDIPAAGAVCILEYNLANTRWELLNPGVPNLISLTNIWAKAQSGLQNVLTSTANHIAVNAALANNFVHTMTENTTIDNPTNIVAGTTYMFTIIQAATPKTLNLGSYFKPTDGVSFPGISTTSGAVNTICCYANSTSHIGYSLLKYGVS